MSTHMYKAMDCNPNPRALETDNEIYESIWVIDKAGQQMGRET